MNNEGKEAHERVLSDREEKLKYRMPLLSRSCTDSSDGMIVRFKRR